MRFVELAHANVIEDTGGKLWLPLSDLSIAQAAGDRPELIRIGDDYFDVEGYSMKRRCFWIKRVQIDASNIDEEMREFYDEL